MDRTFNNTDAAIFGTIALAEVIFFFVYLIVATLKLRKQIVTMGKRIDKLLNQKLLIKIQGRLIPTLHVVVVGGTVSLPQVGQPQPGVYPPQQLPPQSGSYPTQTQTGN